MRFLRVSIFMLLCNLVTSQTLHLVLVSDTDDVAIGKGCQVNHSRLSKQLNKIAAVAPFAIRQYDLTGTIVTKAAITQCIKGLKSKEEDLIWFHFSGHGINDGHSEWPILQVQDGSLSLQSIHRSLLRKSVKLLITTADCCNVGTAYALKGEKIFIHPEVKSDEEVLGYQSLFVETSGHILACGSQKGTPSRYSQALGGYFTVGLCESLHEAGEKNFSTDEAWERTLQMATQYTWDATHQLGKPQRPQYRVELDGEDSPTYYLVKRHDTLYSIAKKHQVSVAQLKEWNSDVIKNIRVIQPGMKLLIYQP